MARVSKSEKLFFANKELFVGMDVHKAKWVVTIRTYDFELKTFSMQPSPGMLEELLVSTYAGANYKIVYDAALAGFGYTINFTEKGYQIIVTPTNRIYKNASTIRTDKIDSRKLAFQHSRGLLKEVKVPEKKIREFKYIFRIYDKQKMRKGQILRQVKAILEQKNHPLKWEKWNKGLVERLKDLKFEEKLFDLKFGNLLKPVTASNGILKSVMQDCGPIY